MARTKKYTPEETLRSLFNLQFIDSRIDNMREVRGELPIEVKDLEDEMVGLSKRLEKVEDETCSWCNHIRWCRFCLCEIVPKNYLGEDLIFSTNETFINQHLFQLKTA